MQKNINNLFLYQPLVGEKIGLPCLSTDEKTVLLRTGQNFLLTGFINEYLDLSENYKFKQDVERISKIYQLRNLTMRSDLKKICSAFKKKGISYVLLKGMAIDVLKLYPEGVRQCRDIDILVEKEQVHKAFNCLKKLGYSYTNRFASNEFKFFGDSHQLPPLINKNSTIIELHHRVTDKEIFEECFLTEYLFDYSENISGLHIPNHSGLIAHALYHGLLHHNLTQGPIFIFDIFILYKSLNMKWPDLEPLLIRMDLSTKFKEIDQLFKLVMKNKQINEEVLDKISNITESFNWEAPKKEKLYLPLNKRKTSKRYLSKNLIANKLNNIRYQYQTDYFSLRYLLGLVIEFIKNLKRFGI